MYEIEIVKKIILGVTVILSLFFLYSCKLVEVLVANTATIVVQHKVNDFTVDSRTNGYIRDIRLIINDQKKVLDAPDSTETNPVHSGLWEVTWYGVRRDFDIDYNYDYYETDTVTGVVTYSRVTGTYTLKDLGRGDYLNVDFDENESGLKINVSKARHFWEE